MVGVVWTRVNHMYGPTSLRGRLDEVIIGVVKRSMARAKDGSVAFDASFALNGTTLQVRSEQDGIEWCEKKLREFLKDAGLEYVGHDRR